SRDWSSDVCSSDLGSGGRADRGVSETCLETGSASPYLAPVPTAPPEEFQADVLRVIPELQRQTGRVLEEVGGSTAELAALCERLGIHRKLACRVRRFAHCPDPCRLGRLRPAAWG